MESAAVSPEGLAGLDCSSGLCKGHVQERGRLWGSNSGSSSTSSGESGTGEAGASAIFAACPPPAARALALFSRAPAGCGGGGTGRREGSGSGYLGSFPSGTRREDARFRASPGHRDEGALGPSPQPAGGTACQPGRRRLPHSSSSLARAGRPRQQHKVIDTRREPQPRLTAGRVPAQGEGWGGGRGVQPCVRVGVRVCVNTLAPARACGSPGVGRAPRGWDSAASRNPPCKSSLLAPGNFNGHTAPRWPGTGGQVREHRGALCALGPAFGLAGPQPAPRRPPSLASGSSLESDTR